MAKRLSRSRLQNQILLYLQQQTVGSLANLARSLKVQRSSVSRAMHTLKEAGLVSKAGNEWMLTPKGETEAQLVADRIPEETARAAESVLRLVDQSKQAFALLGAESPISALGLEAATSIRSLYDSLAVSRAEVSSVISSLNAASTFLLSEESGYPGIIKAFEEMPESPLSLLAKDSALSVFLDEMAELPKNTLATLQTSIFIPSPAELAVQQLTTMLDDIDAVSSNSLAITLGSRLAQEAMDSFSLSQRANLSVFQDALSNDVLFPVLGDLGQVGVEISHIIDNVGAISHALKAGPDLAFALDLMPNLAEVARTYTGYLLETTGGILNDVQSVQIGAGLMVPTETTMNYSDSLRTIVGSPPAGHQSALYPRGTNGETVIWQDEVARYEPNFRSLGLQNLWSGAWSVLSSNSPDRLRQAAHSGRELLIQTLEALAPDSIFTRDELERDGHNGRATHRMRVSRVIARNNSSRSSIAWSESMIDALLDTYNHLAGVSHYREIQSSYDERQVAGLLMALGGFLVFIGSES